MKVPLSGGAPVAITEINSNLLPFGISWGSNGKIVFADQISSGLKTIPDIGGTPENLTQLDTAANEVSHRLPHFLPDGSGVLFTVLRYRTVTPDWSKAQIWIKVLKTGERKLLIENGTDGQYVGNGWLMFARLGKLWAVRFDPKAFAVTGEAIQVVDGVTHATYEQGSPYTSGAAQFSVSRNGTLIYAPGGIEPPVQSSLVWMDRSGKATPLGTKPMPHLSVRVSPDGKEVLFNQYYVNADLWIYDTVRGVLSRETFGGQNAFPLWTRDGSAITFRSDRSGPNAIYQQKTGSPEIMQLTLPARTTRRIRGLPTGRNWLSCVPDRRIPTRRATSKTFTSCRSIIRKRLIRCRSRNSVKPTPTFRRMAAGSPTILRSPVPARRKYLCKVIRNPVNASRSLSMAEPSRPGQRTATNCFI